MVEKKERKRQEVLVAKKNHVLNNLACAKIKIETAFKRACVITINSIFLYPNYLITKASHNLGVDLITNAVKIREVVNGWPVSAFHVTNGTLGQKSEEGRRREKEGKAS